MTEAFFIKPFLALILIAISSALLGVFVLWKKLSYFGDAISHSILLGAALGAIFHLNQSFSLLLFAVIFALLVSFAAQNRYFSRDLIIAISSYFCVALAIIISNLAGQNLDFSDYIFGDILSVTNLEIIALTAITIVTIFFTIFAFKRILLINLSSDLAKIEGIKTDFWRHFFLVLLTLIIALSVKAVGILLVTALLILPAAIARIFANSALQMMCLSVIFSITVSAFAGLVAMHYNISIGALIIAVFGVIFILSLSIKK